MGDHSRNTDEAAIDRTLAALGRVTPPDGLEARTNQRLRYAAARDVRVSFISSVRTWWFGALTGAAVASLVFCIALFGVRGGGEHSASDVRAVGTEAAGALDVRHTAASGAEVPCVAPAVQPNPARPKRAAVVTAATEPNRPVRRVPDELTPQERALVRLTKIADPNDLSTMTLEARAALDAQESAAFQKFFTPPPPPRHDEGVNP